MKHNKEYIKGAIYVINQFRKKLPFKYGRDCDCSADALYYLNQIAERLLKRMKSGKL